MGFLGIQLGFGGYSALLEQQPVCITIQKPNRSEIKSLTEPLIQTTNIK